KNSKNLWEHPFKRTTAKYSIYPTRLGDTLFYSPSRSLHAVDAYTGEVLWRTPQNMLGWRDMLPSRIRAYEKGVDLEGSLVRPSASQGVVVTSLQIPLTFEDQDDYGDLQIIRIIPERRLFAFDAETGARLWDTLPPPFWDGEAGSFADRMTIVGSPIIARTRVLVPTARLRGRVEFHIGCFDLHSGELLWDAPLLTGQRPLNMFGRLVKEYVAPPVRVVGDKVVVATQLGTVACLDLFTGETLWQTLYEQIPIRPGTYYEDGRLASVWRNAPPVVADGVVVVAPYDGYDLIGIDLRTGIGLWNLSNAELNKRVGGDPRRRVVNVLLDADQRRVYLAGLKVVAFEAPGGLRHEAPLNRAWVFPARGTTSGTFLSGQPRPVISNERVYVPASGELHVLDRRDGRRVASVRWDRSGNLLLGEGMLFTLTSFTLNGFFEWETMVRRARARLAADPESPRAINTLALLLYKRGLSAMADGDYREATRWLANARGELEGLVDHATHADASLRQSLHGILRAEGRNLRLGADARGALRMLRRARELAPTREHLRDTLLEEQEILRTRDPDGWLEIMAELEQQFGEMSLEVLVERSRTDARGWTGHLIPRAASLAGEDPSEQDAALPLGLWVLIERSQFWPARHRQNDAQRQYTDLHQILNEYGDTPLFEGGDAFDWAAARIGERLAGGDRRGYQEFEARAQELLDRAQSERDLELLETVPRLYPHSHAADASDDARIALSLLEGDAQRVAEIVLGKALPDYWHPRRATQPEVRHLLSLARALGQRGNLEYRAGLSASLARYHPDLWPDDAEGQPAVRLAELARSWAVASPEPAPTPTFDATIVTAGSVTSTRPFRPVGVIPPGPGQTGRVLMLCDDSRLYVYSTQSGSDTSWSYSFDNPSDTHRGDPL
ncbi:MAG: PQQ-binding-like beta-propeller repeat protein, partial [Planctomycetota bacterium]